MNARPGRLGIGVLGSGRVGTVLAAALRAAGHQITGVHAVSEDSRERVEALLPGIEILEIPELLRRSEAVLIAVPDDALGPLVEGLAEAGQWQAGQLLIHTSARHGVDVLTPAREHGVIPLAVHPAMDFTGTSLDIARLQDVSFGVSADRLMLPIAQALVVEMGGEPVVIEEEDRELYAAALSLVSDVPGPVVAQAADALAAIGVEDPSRVLTALLRSGVENALMAGPDAGASRAKARTASQVHSALAAWARPDAPEAAGESYAALVRAATARALRRGTIDEERAAAVLDALGGDTA